MIAKDLLLEELFELKHKASFTGCSYNKTRLDNLEKAIAELERLECVGQSNDYGDKTYFVDEIKSVNYIGISELEYINRNIKSLEYQQNSLVNTLCHIENKLEELYTKQRKLNEEK